MRAQGAVLSLMRHRGLLVCIKPYTWIYRVELQDLSLRATMHANDMHHATEDELMQLDVTAGERAKAQLSAVHLLDAVQSIRKDGYVILANVIAPDHLDTIRERMAADSQELITAGKWGGAGSVAGHLQQGAPPFAPYIFRDIVANPFAIQVSKAVLGPGCYNRFYNGNANCPGSGTQPLHADTPHLWPNLEVPHPAHALVINVTLVDATSDNGATEIWPGTHLLPFDGQHISTDMEESRRHVMPPVQAIAPKGSIVIRDMRMWHRGVPNRTDEVRHMIAMVHQIRWMQRPHPLLFDQSCAAEFPPIADFEHNVEFTTEPLHYLYSRTPTIEKADRTTRNGSKP